MDTLNGALIIIEAKRKNGIVNGIESVACVYMTPNNTQFKFDQIIVE